MEDNPKPTDASFAFPIGIGRIKVSRWTRLKENEQGPITESRFGKRGVWLSSYPSPRVDPDAKNSGSARAIAYQIIRHGLISDSQKPNRGINYFGLASDENTLRAGYSFDPLFGEGENYGQNAVGQRAFSKQISSRTHWPQMGNRPRLFQWLRVIDFGIRAYTINESTDGTDTWISFSESVSTLPRSMNWCLL